MKTHLVSPRELEPTEDGRQPTPYTCCGRRVAGTLGRTGYRFSQKQFTTNPHEATCKACVKSPEHADAYVAHWTKHGIIKAEEPTPEPAPAAAAEPTPEEKQRESTLAALARAEQQLEDAAKATRQAAAALRLGQTFTAAQYAVDAQEASTRAASETQDVAWRLQAAS